MYLNSFNYTEIIQKYSKNFKENCHPSFLLFLSASDKKHDQGGKSPKVKPGTAGSDVRLQKDVSLASANPNARGPVTRAPGPRGPGHLPGQPGAGRGQGPPPRR